MPMPQHCIDCDKIAVVLNKDIPYCPRCYKKSQKSTYREGHLFKTKLKN